MSIMCFTHSIMEKKEAIKHVDEASGEDNVRE